MRFLDEDDSLKYRIAEVSNNGKRIFYVNPVTGIAYIDKKLSAIYLIIKYNFSLLINFDPRRPRGYRRC